MILPNLRLEQKYFGEDFIPVRRQKPKGILVHSKWKTTTNQNPVLSCVGKYFSQVVYSQLARYLLVIKRERNLSFL